MESLAHEDSKVRAAVADTVFAPDLLTLELVPGDGARRLKLVDALVVCRRMRDALLAHGDGAPRPVRSCCRGMARVAALSSDRTWPSSTCFKRRPPNRIKPRD